MSKLAIVIAGVLALAAGPAPASSQTRPILSHEGVDDMENNSGLIGLVGLLGLLGLRGRDKRR